MSKFAEKYYTMARHYWSIAWDLETVLKSISELISKMIMNLHTVPLDVKRCAKTLLRSTQYNRVHISWGWTQARVSTAGTKFVEYCFKNEVRQYAAWKLSVKI